MLKRRLGIASVLGFGALFGLVTQHAVGSQKHKRAPAAQPAATRRTSASSFFDTHGSGYSFDDPSARGVQSAQPSASAPSQGPPPGPVAQSSGS